MTRALRAMYGPDLNRAPHPCHRVCVECGYSHDPTPTGDPMRRSGETMGKGTTPCPACGRSSAIDVTYDATAMNLCEADDLAGRPQGVRPSIAAIVLAAPVVVTVVGLGQPGALFIGIITMFMVCAVFATTTIAFDSRRARPRRWHLALPPKTRVELSRTGSVHGARALRAPLSGQECIAYEIAIAPAGTRPRRDGDWLVREQHATRLTLDGHAVEGADVALVLCSGARRPLQVDPEVLARFLRARGVMADDEVDVYETLVTEGQSVTLRRHRKSRVHTLVPATA